MDAPAATTGGKHFPITVAAYDAFGNVAVGYTGTVHFTSTDPAAVLPTDQTHSGPGSAQVTLTTEGTWTITAGDAARGLRATAAPITVTPISLTVEAPSTAFAGKPFSLSITARDEFGNIADWYTGAVHFTSTDSAAMLPADQSLTNGVGTVSVTLTTEGTDHHGQRRECGDYR